MYRQTGTTNTDTVGCGWGLMPAQAQAMVNKGITSTSVLGHFGPWSLRTFKRD